MLQLRRSAVRLLDEPDEGDERLSNLRERHITAVAAHRPTNRIAAHGFREAAALVEADVEARATRSPIDSAPLQVRG